MKLTFWGATQSVTGSCHMLEIAGRTVLLDCGMYQGNRKWARENNGTFPCLPSQVDSVVLSHAHIDHAGNIPTLIKQGAKAPVYCTKATSDLCSIMLRDSAFIQEKDAEFLNRKLQRLEGKNAERIDPLYTTADADRALEFLKPIRYDKNFDVIQGRMSARFREAGHVLGSAFVESQLRAENHEVRLTFSGDLGRHKMPILRDPERPEPADYLILESTYGGKVHAEYILAETKFGEDVRRVIARRGKIVIPAFSVGRTQEVVFALNRLWNQGKIPRVPVYVDSPLSTNATEIFRENLDTLDDEVMHTLKTDPDPFGFAGLLYVRDVQRSKDINRVNGPCIIISASGMAESGRVLHHLKNIITDPKNAVFIVGFMAENTLGRRLVEKQPEVRIFGDMFPLRAEVVTFNAFSAHADSNGLREFAADVARDNRLKKIFLVHGEESSKNVLASLLGDDLPGVEIVIPERGSSYNLT